MARPGIHYTALDRRLQRLGNMMGSKLVLDKTAGRYRVELADGSRQVSPRLSAHQMLDWVEAGIAVMENLNRGHREPKVRE